MTSPCPFAWRVSLWFCLLFSFPLRSWGVIEWLRCAPGIHPESTHHTGYWKVRKHLYILEITSSSQLHYGNSCDLVSSMWQIAHCLCLFMRNSSEVYSSLLLFTSRLLVMSEPVPQIRFHEIHSLQRSFSVHSLQKFLLHLFPVSIVWLFEKLCKLFAALEQCRVHAYSYFIISLHRSLCLISNNR